MRLKIGHGLILEINLSIAFPVRLDTDLVILFPLLVMMMIIFLFIVDTFVFVFLLSLLVFPLRRYGEKAFKLCLSSLQG